MSSGQPVNNIQEMKKIRDRYIKNLDLEIENNDFNLQQNKKFLMSGVVPSKIKDYRTIDEKLSDVYKLKTDLRNDLLDITDGSNAQKIVNSLADNDVIFLAQNIENIKTDIKKKFKYGVLSDIFLDYFNKYTQLQNKNYGLLNPFYETKLDEISNKINSINNVIIDNMDLDYLKNILEKYKNEQPQKYNDILKKLNLIENQINFVNFHKDNIEDMTNEEKKEFDDIVETLPSQQFIINKADELKEDITRDRLTEILEEIKNEISPISYNPPNEDPEELKKLLPMDEIKLLTLKELKTYLRYLDDYSDKNSPYKTRINNLTKVKTTKGDIIDFFDEFNELLYESGYPSYYDWSYYAKNKSKTDYEKEINKYATEKGINQPLLNIQEPETLEEYKTNYFIDFGEMPSPEEEQLFIKSKSSLKKTEQKGKGVIYTNKKKIKMKGRGITIDKIDYKNSINQDKKFLYFGKYLIDKNKLEHNNVLSLKSKKGTLIKSDILNNKIKDILLEFIKQGKLNYDEYYNLSNEEKNYIYDLYKQSNLIDKLNIKSPDKSENDKIIDRFLILKGQLNAGNDSLELIKEFKLILLKLKNMKMLPKNEVNNMLELLLSLGY